MSDGSEELGEQTRFESLIQHQPRPVPFHYVYSVLPSKVFAGRVPSILLLHPPDLREGWLAGLWRAMATHLSPDERREANHVKLSVYRLAERYPALLVQLPLPQRDLEVYFLVNANIQKMHELDVVLCLTEHMKYGPSRKGDQTNAPPIAKLIESDPCVP